MAWGIELSSHGPAPDLQLMSALQCGSSSPFSSSKTARNDPEIVSAAPHEIFLFATSRLSKPPPRFPLGTRWGLGATEDLVKYVSVACVSPVASSCRAGSVFAHTRRRLNRSGVRPSHPFTSRAFGPCRLSRAPLCPSPLSARARLSRAERDAAQTQTFGFADANAAVMSGAAVPNTGGVTAADSFGSPGIVGEARRYIGGNPTWARQPVVRALQTWCCSTGIATAPTWRTRSPAMVMRVSGPQVGLPPI